MKKYGFIFRCKNFYHILITSLVIQLLWTTQVVSQVISMSGKVTSSRVPVKSAMVTVIDNTDTTRRFQSLTDQSGYYQMNIVITSVNSGTVSLPTEFTLEQNYPNPFNPTAVIQYAIPKREKVVLKVYSLLGQEVATLVDEIQEPSQYKVTFDGRGLASGVYFYKLQTGYFSKTKKMVLAK